MKKVIKIDKNTQIKINTAMNWAFIYREYFGHDIIPDLVPALDAFTHMFVGLVNGDDIDEDNFDLYGLEVTTLYQIIWALAKNEDNDIPDIEKWLHGFDKFPLDIILPDVIEALSQTMMSTKKAELLQGQITDAALRLIKSLSLPPTED